MDDIDKKELETIDIDTPLSEPNAEPILSEAPNIPEPKKSRKGLVVGIVITVIVALLAAGFAYYWFYIKEDAASIVSTENAVSKTEDPADTTDYAKDLIEKIRVNEASLKTTYPKSKVEDGGSSAPPYKYGSSTYYVSGDFGHSLLITDSSDGTYDQVFNGAAEQIATSVLDAENLTKKQTNFSFRYSNDNGKVICSVSHLSYPVYISCANTQDYKAPSEAVAPFAKAYLASPETSGNSEIVFGEPKITTKNDGYKNATVGITSVEGVGGFAGLFYHNKAAWNYWQGTQSVIPCKDYNTYPLQKAFEGDECHLEGQDKLSSVVVTLKPLID